MAVERSHPSLFQLREKIRKRENAAFLEFIMMKNVTSVFSFHSAKQKEFKLRKGRGQEVRQLRRGRKRMKADLESLVNNKQGHYY